MAATHILLKGYPTTVSWINESKMVDKENDTPIFHSVLYRQRNSQYINKNDVYTRCVCDVAKLPRFKFLKTGENVLVSVFICINTVIQVFTMVTF